MSTNQLSTVPDSGARALEALGDPMRRAIFERLLGGPQPVGKLADTLPVSRPAVSQHLKVLKDTGLVTARAEGNRRVYRVAPEGVEAMREYLDRMWVQALAAFAAVVEQQSESTKGSKQ